MFKKMFNIFFSGDSLASCHTCGKRLEDKSVMAKAESLMVKSKETLKQIEVLSKKGDHKAVLDLAEEILAQQKGLFHKLHHMKISMLDKAMDACIYLEMWDSALAYGLETMDSYKLYYPRYHPVVGIQLFRIGKFLQDDAYRQVHLDLCDKCILIYVKYFEHHFRETASVSGQDR